MVLNSSAQVPSEGTILSAAPSLTLPNGLLHHVVSVAQDGNTTTVGLSPAGIYEVAPNMDFDIPLSSSQTKQLRAAVECGGSQSLSPYAQISDVHLTGRWTTTHVLFANITTGADIELHFRASAGFSVTSPGAINCSVPLPSFAVEGLAGPIPVFGSINPSIKAEVGGKATLSAGGSANLKLGTAIRGVPPTALPILGVDSPRFDFHADVFSGVTASVALDAELGIGVHRAANLHVALGNSLDFSGSQGSCSWDLNLGTFSAAGELGPFSVTSPSTPPLFRKNLWQSACTGPAPPPFTPTLPFVRATMNWDTDSDLDLYTWDSDGREGVDLDVSTLADHVGACTAVLSPLTELIRRHVFAAERVHGDDTTVPLLAKGKTITARLWTYVRDDRPFAGPDPPAAVFYYSRNRNGEHPARHLAGYAGILQADAYAGFGDLYDGRRKPGPITEAACWSHGRRHFFELADLRKAPLAVEAVRRIDAIFAIEREINGRSAGERVAARQERIVPLIAELEKWMWAERARLSRHAGTAKAIDYMLKRWPAFTRFLDDGRICLSNNAAERALRGIALGRRAWLFAGSDRGGERAAAMYTLIATAKLNDINPQAWLADVLRRIADHPASRLHELLPWHWKTLDHQAAAA